LKYALAILHPRKSESISAALVSSFAADFGFGCRRCGYSHSARSGEAAFEAAL
jgi:hypothetical protein